MKDYYVYALLDPRDTMSYEKAGMTFPSEPKYIGKGRGNRARMSALWDYKYTNGRKCQWIKSLVSKGIEPVVFFIARNLSEEEAFTLERNLISGIGRVDAMSGPLLNMSKGGEGGSQNMKDKQEGYRKKLLEHGDEIRLAGEFLGMRRYVEHECKYHGPIFTSPFHVLRKMEEGRPLCPKCGVSKRGPQIRRHRLESGEESYRELMEGISGYRLSGPYLGAVVRTEHACDIHGVFSISPANVRSKVLSGLKPCPDCNMINWKPGPKENNPKRVRAGEEYKNKLENAYGDEFSLAEEYKGSQISSQHVCSKHGVVDTLPSEVKSRMKRGLPGCPTCGKERVREILIARNKLGRECAS